MSRDIWVFCEQRNGELQRVALELMSEAIKLADKLCGKCCALLIGDQIGSIAETLAAWNIDKVYSVEHPLLTECNSDLYTKIIADVIKRYNPRLFLFGATPISREFLPRVAGRLGGGMISNCSNIRVNDNKFSYVKPVYSGKIDCTVEINSDQTQIVSIIPGAMDIEKVVGKSVAAIEPIDVALDQIKVRVKKIGFEKGDPRRMDLTEAETVVAIGRGLGNPEKIKIIEELADSIGASLAGTRVAVDLGWLSRERQVGQTGKTISPKVYIACGLSGDMKHTIGMKDSECIIAINQDRDAPIFKIADVKVYKDLFEIVPAITQHMNNMKIPKENEEKK